MKAHPEEGSDPTDPAPDAGAPPLIPPALALVTAVFAVSWAGPLVRFATAPAIAVAAWRLAFSVGFIAVVIAIRDRGTPGWGFRGWGLTRRRRLVGIFAGALLAGHFWTWIASLRLTTVASSVVLVSMQPIFVASLSVVFLRERPSRAQWLGIATATLGAVVVGWGDFALGGDALLGDLLALIAALLVAAYYVIGRHLRQYLDLWRYVLLVYGACAVVLFAILLAAGAPVAAYPRGDWLVFLALAAGPMMLGHTGVNYAIRYYPAFIANLAMLGEPIGATLIAWALPAIGEVPGPRTVIGGILVLGGIAIATVRGRGGARATRGTRAQSPQR